MKFLNFKNIERFNPLYKAILLSRYSNFVNIYDYPYIPEDKFVVESFWHPTYHDGNTEMFGHGTGILQKNNIPDNVMQRIKNRTAYLLLPHLTEGDLYKYEWIEKIEFYFSYHNIPLSQIIYVSNAVNGDSIYREYCKEKNKEPSINIEYFPFFSFSKWGISEDKLEKNFAKKYKSGEKQKTFLCLNRRYKAHRTILFLLIHKFGLLDNFFYSFPKIEPDNYRNGFNFFKTSIHPSNYQGEIKFTDSEVIEAFNKLPLILDTENFNSFPVKDSFKKIDDFYENSLISLVNETNFHNTTFHFTEKTFNTIVNMHPFILASVPSSLQYLRSKGFKTFGMFWDESYDFEMHVDKRLEKIANLVKSICEWSNDKKVEFSIAVKEIVEYNYNHFYDMNHREIFNLIYKYK